MATMTRRKVLIAAGLVTLLAVIGAIVGIVVWQTSSSSTDANTNAAGDAAGDAATTPAPTGKDSSKKDQQTKPSNGGADEDGSDESPGKVKPAGSSSTDAVTPAKNVSTDPSEEKYTLTAFALGDWGVTEAGDSMCNRRKGYTCTNLDKRAQNSVGTLMGVRAEQIEAKPKVVIGHGDNFYWTGINGPGDQQKRFTYNFENMYSAESLKSVKWVNVMGNHDYGGSSYICHDGKSGSRACKDADDVVKGLEDKLALQRDYTSPENDRWMLKDTFYVHTIEDKATGVSMDIFNIDTNDADVHAMEQICCQCYSYAGPDFNCKQVHKGHEVCAGGDDGIYDACEGFLKKVGEDSRTKLQEALAASKATWKIVNTHYSPYNHYGPPRQAMWWSLLEGSGLNVWMNGHTHGEKHDYSAPAKIHFIENGAGGGILSESASGIPPYAEDKVEKVWTYGNGYGFFELSASENWLKIEYLTFDDSWVVQEDFEKSTIGGVESQHCWYIPRDGGKGKPCEGSA